MLHEVSSVAMKPDDALDVVYDPCPDTLERGDPYCSEAYNFVRNLCMPFIEKSKLLDKTPKRIYVSRARATKRRIINERELIEYLGKYGFHTIYLEDLGIEQMVYFYNADIIISPHGAGLVNSIFCKKGASTIEICSKTMTSLKHFSHIAECMELKYKRIQDVQCDDNDINSDMYVPLYELRCA